MKNILWYNKKASCFEEALPVGNGRIGAMVYGNPKCEKISLNEDSLWSGYPKDLNNKEAYKYLPEVRKNLFDGNITEAESLINHQMHGHWSEAYLPFGEIAIDYEDLHGEYRRELDISKGIAKIQKGSLTETVFVSHPDELVAINIKSDEEFSAVVTIKSQLESKSYCLGECLVIEGQTPEICMPPYYNKGVTFDYGAGAMKFCGAIKASSPVSFSGNKIIIRQKKEITLFVSLATSFVAFDKMPNGNALEKALSYFKGKTFEDMLSDHINDFSSLFDRVDIDLGETSDLPTDKRLKKFQRGNKDNDLVALLFQYGRYLTISASRFGTNAMNLQGIWNEKIRAPWSSSYTTNINTEMNYFPTDVVNLGECIEPLLSLAKKLVQNGKVTAKSQYGCGGSVAHHNSDIWGNTYPAGDPFGKEKSTSYACWSSALPWILNELYNHYHFSGDESFKEELKPLFAECIDFYKDFLVEKDGFSVTAPSLSPENTYIKSKEKHSICIMPTMDIGILDEFFANAKAMGFDIDIKLPPYKIGSDGRLLEWAEEYGEAEVEHRHVSHLYCIYPSNKGVSEEVLAGAEKSLLKRGFGGTGWSLAWKVCLWARLKNGENAYKLIKNQLRPVGQSKITFLTGGGSYPNLFDAHPPFQIDGNFGVTAGIAEMFLNESLPKCWQNGYIKGLKTFGNKTVDVYIENGKTRKIEKSC